MQTRDIVRLAPGSGLLARRSSNLLFVPDAHAELVAVFMGAETGQRLDAVTAYSEDSDHQVRAFVVIEWTMGVRVAVLGDVEVTSDQRSLPRLSGAGAGTWVERSVRTDSVVTIGVGVADVHDATDLQEGVVQAGSFALKCAPSSSFGTKPATDTRFSELIDDNTASSAQATEAAVIAGSLENPEQFKSDVPTADQQGAGVREPIASTGATPELAEHPLSGTEAPVEDSIFQAGTVKASTTPSGHTRTAINEFGEVVESSVLPPVPAIDNAAIQAPWPTTSWRLVFLDGPTENVDETLVLGRKPTLSDNEVSAGVRAVRLDCSKVSGRHLEVRPDSGGLTVTDLGSSNSSFVLTTGDGQLVQLDPGIPHRIDSGMIVQIGTKRFRAEQTGLVS